MIDGRRSRVVAALGLALFICFAVVAHIAIVDSSRLPAVGASLSVFSIAAFVVVPVFRSRGPLSASLAVAAAVFALWMGWPVLKRHFPSVFFVEHAGANLALAIVFGRTLIGNREALCTRCARFLHKALPPDVERYTRQVTIAWTIFFGFMFAVSCALYISGFVAVWSVFANLLSPVLVAAMFVAEYLIRRLVLPKWERTSLLGGIRAVARYFAVAQPDAPR